MRSIAATKPRTYLSAWAAPQVVSEYSQTSINRARAAPKMLAATRFALSFGFLHYLRGVQRDKLALIGGGTGFQFFPQPTPVGFLVPFIVPSNQIPDVLAGRRIKTIACRAGLHEALQLSREPDINAFRHAGTQQIVPQKVNSVGQRSGKEVRFTAEESSPASSRPQLGWSRASVVRQEVAAPLGKWVLPDRYYSVVMAFGGPRPHSETAPGGRKLRP